MRVQPSGYYSSICTTSSKKSPQSVMQIALHPRALYSCPSSRNAKPLLIARLDKIIRQLLNSCGCVSGNHSIAVVSDKDSLCSFDDNNAFSALLFTTFSSF